MRPRLIQTGLLATLLALPAAVQAQFDYTTTNGAITITGYTGPGGDVTIPAAINGLPVTSIGDFAFIDCYSLTSVTIPNGVTSIGDEAFSECDNLTNATIPDSVTSIGRYAFYECYSLTSMVIPNGVTYIGYYTFCACTSLTNVVFPTSVTAIEEYAFASCISLTSVTFPSSLNFIGGYAFPDTSLTNVVIPSSVDEIGDWAFWNCRSLIEITVAAESQNYSSLDGVLFNKNHTTLNQYPMGKGGTGYTIPDSVTSIRNAAFANSGLTSVTIPNNVTSIGDSAFANVALTNVTIGSGVTSIGDYAFSECPLTGVTIPDSVTSLGYGALYECHNLTNVVIGNNLTSIPDYTFAGTALTSVIIPDSVTSIVNDAFLECNSLTSIIVATQNQFYSSFNGVLFDKSQTTLIFYPPGHGHTYAIPDSVTSIGDQAFRYCDNLTSVTIGNSVTHIGVAAFADCRRLTFVFFAGNAPTDVEQDGIEFSIVDSHNGYPFWIPESVTICYLPDTTGWSNTFAGRPTAMLNGPPQFGATDDGLEYLSDGVKTIITGYTGSNGVAAIPATINGLPVTRIGDYAFYYCTNLNYATIPNSVTSIGSYAFAGTALISVTIPNNVTNIGDEAFSDCSSLTSVYFKGNAPAADLTVFIYDINYYYYGGYYSIVTAYYLPGTTGWDDFSANTGIPAVQWNPLIQTSDASFGVRTNQFGFNIAWVSGQTVVVEACTNLSNPVWTPIATNTLIGDTSYFRDPQSANLPARFYRLRSP